MYRVIINSNGITSTIARTADRSEAYAIAREQLSRTDLWSVAIETEGTQSTLTVACWEDWGDGMHQVPVIQYQNA
jgi:hypothetical protein